MLHKLFTKGEASFRKFVAEPKNVKRILVVRNGLIGDLVAVTNSLTRLHKNFPEAVIDVLAGPSCKSLFDNIPYIGSVYFFSYNLSGPSVIKQIGFFSGLSKNKYDLLLIHECNTHFTFMTLLTRAKYRVGFTNKMYRFYDYHTPRPDKQMALAELGLIEEWTKETPYQPGLVINEGERDGIVGKLSAEGLNVTRKFAIIHIGSSHHNSDRQWDLKKVPELATKLIEEKGYQIVFSGVNDDVANIKMVRKKITNPTYSLAGKTTLRELLALVSVSKLVIGPDTGILHIAAALNVPSIMLMGISDPDDTGTYNPNGNARIVTAGLECQPCVHKNPRPSQWHGCQKQLPVKCMEEITVDMVLGKIDS